MIGVDSRMGRLNRWRERLLGGGGRNQDKVQPQAELLISQEDLATAIVLLAAAVGDLEAAEELVRRGCAAAAPGEGGATTWATALSHDGHVDSKALVK